MLKGLSLVDLAKKIEGNANLKRDFIAPTDKLTMQVQHGAANEKPVAVLELPEAHGTFPILPHTHDQIGAHTKIPAQYYDRMHASMPDLLATNVNAWFRNNPQPRMIRTLGGDARAFLSNAYQRIEHEEVAQVALPVLMNLPNVQIVSSEVTDKRLYIHFVVPGIQREVKKGDIVQAGGILRNSEVGDGALAVEGLFWRLWCLNGAKTSDTFRRAHVGRRVEDNDALWKEDTKKADDKAVLLKVRDMVAAVVDEARFIQQVNKLTALTEGRIEGDPSKAVEVLAQKIGATDAERSGILRSLIEGGDLSRWGVLNAVTAQAHTARSYDRAVEFESIGGSLIELPRDAWKEILTAA